MAAFGDKVRDRITGLEGIALGHAEYANGLAQTQVQPCLTNAQGDVRALVWIDDVRLDVTEPGAVHIETPTPGAYL